jgi:sugar-specific transcriptional regulator TrmB
MLTAMSHLEDGAKMLSEFGLTPYEAKVYLAVVRLGPTSASKISKLAGVRREEVYRTLPRLEKVGLVDRVLGRPVKVRALSLEDALSLLIDHKKEELEKEVSELGAKKERFLRSFKSDVQSADLRENGSHFVLISEKEAIARRTAVLAGNARKSIDLADSSDCVIRFILNYADALKKASSRGIKFRILTNCPDDENTVPDALENMIPKKTFSLRYHDEIPSRYVIFDSRESMITTSPEGGLAESNTLWTDDTSLVTLMQRGFEDQFRSATDCREFHYSASDKLTRVLKGLKPRDHAILVYNSPEVKREALFAYIMYGLERGEAAKYVCSEETPSEIRKGMRSFGVNVEEYEKTGALDILHYTSVYIKDGKFDIPDVMNTWNNYYREAMAMGFKGLRVTGEMSCFIEHRLVRELLEYEQSLHTTLDIPMTAICAYNSQALGRIDNPIDVYSELVKAHGKILFAGSDTRNSERMEIRKA